MSEIKFKPIGIIHTPFRQPKGTPIQPSRSDGAVGWIKLYSEYVRGVSDLDGFSHIVLIYYFHLSKGFELMVTPYLDNNLRGLFATRAPGRPNPIGISVVKLQRIEDNILHVIDVDIVDGTPLLDIKPHIPDFNSPENVRVGWLNNKNDNNDINLADNRFHKKEPNG